MGACNVTVKTSSRVGGGIQSNGSVNAGFNYEVDSGIKSNNQAGVTVTVEQPKIESKVVIGTGASIGIYLILY